jgi:CO dehydrogenase/acetyl-CoA synthase delta subunit
MSTHTPSGSNWADAVQPLEARRQARVVASFAEYLAEDVHGHPERAPEAIASLAEWCEGDPSLLAQARADVLRHTRTARAAVAENNREAVELLELVASA